ncbi:MAG: 3-mercaptopyruvate sulfurtransferase, partial [Pseudomonadota bacterium]
DLRLADASYYLPADERDPRAEFEAEHIPGAVFFDLDDVADVIDGTPMMIPRPEKFSSRMRKLGIGDGNRVIVYDTAGLFSAARAWWMLKVMGVADVYVLDGGLPKWKSENRPLSDDTVRPSERHFTARLNNLLVRTADQVVQATKDGDEQIVDVRSASRFAGKETEARQGCRAGHIPNSLNLPYTELLNADGTLKDRAGLRAAFKDAGVELSRPVVTSCGSGVTACIGLLALHELGAIDIALYDGSWAEWGMRADLPIAEGAA